MTDLQRFANQFVESTRDFVFVRPEDHLLILRPNRTHYLNATACEMLQRLYGQTEVDVAALVGELALEYGVEREQVARDLEELLRTLNGLLRDDYSQATRVRFTPFGSHEVKYPVLSEIALTYRCQHRCPFCYADAPRRGNKAEEMTTEQVCRVIDRIRDEAKVPTVSFTGGEPTLRDDLPALVAYAKSRGMRTNLISNGYRLADADLAQRLVASGLDSAQISIEGPTAEAHDAVTKTPGSFTKSLQGIRNLRACGIHTHTNTTICPENRDHVIGMTDLARDLGHEYLSMNMVIRTGGAADGSADTIGYADIGAIVEPILQRCRDLGLRLVWYSPVPYCLFNPVTIGLGSNSCAAADGLLSIAPDGQVLPCSSFETGVGNLLTESFDTVWNRRTARYWRQKEFLPPVCQDCDLKHICCGACPLYWDEQQGFGELPGAKQGRIGFVKQAEWQLKRRWLGRLKGVNLK
jgi:radical SAM protein with 4Fe4S-binding SPASM domain